MRLPDLSCFFSPGLRAWYLTVGQCCSGTHFPLSSVAPTDAPQTSQVWFAHWTRSRFLLRAVRTSSLNRPSQGFTGIGMLLHGLFRIELNTHNNLDAPAAPTEPPKCCERTGWLSRGGVTVVATMCCRD